VEHALPNEIKATLMAGEFIEDHDITAVRMLNALKDTTAARVAMPLAT
jgi:hypothetical protein